MVVEERFRGLPDRVEAGHQNDGTTAPAGGGDHLGKSIGPSVE
jgi:hypothetical protein